MISSPKRNTLKIEYKHLCPQKNQTSSSLFFLRAVMHRLNALHNKTQVVATDELPFNPVNVLLGEADLRAFFDAHGLEDAVFRNINYYRTAFVHRSYCTMKNMDFEKSNERCPADCLPLQDISYERLEFYGDAILDMVIAGYLFERFPDQVKHDEGFLSRTKTKIVNGRMLGSLAAQIGFPKFAILSKQVEDIQGRQNYKIMEDIFEAFIVAIYNDFREGDAPICMKGLEMATRWIINVVEKYIDLPELIMAKTNYKDMLVAHLNHTFKDAPRFFEVAVETRNGAKRFKYCVKNRAGAVLGTAYGDSKKDAENNAALAALQYYGVSVDQGA